MTGTAVSWALGAALATVVSVAVLRLARGRAERPSPAQHADPLLHLLMALGMAAMMLPGGESPRTALRLGFAAIALWLLICARGRHRLHHVAMAAIMALMAGVEAAPGTGTGAASMAGMAMAPPTGHGPPLTLLAAFAYTVGSACVIAWRLPTALACGHRRSGHACANDPLGGACEVLMLLSTAVMLLPAI